MDEENFHRLLHRPGTLVDIGAHDGLLTIPLARLPGSQVLAFEPLPSAFARLQTALRAAFGGDPVLRIETTRRGQNVIQHRRIEAKGARGIDKLTKTHRHVSLPEPVSGSLGEAKGQRGKIRHE